MIRDAHQQVTGLRLQVLVAAIFLEPRAYNPQPRLVGGKS